MGGSVLTAGRRFVFGGYQVLTGLLRFDTSSLPEGASVVSARLRLHVKAKADANDRRLVGEWYDPAAWPIDAGDFSVVAVADALAGADITGLTVNAVNELVLSDLSGIDPGGYSGLRLHIDGGQPGGDNYVQIASYDNTSLPEPKLIVTYTLDGGSPSAPVNTAAPVVSGSAVQGELLTASTGSWTGTQPISYVYQWRRCNTDGAACSDLQGATSQTYLAAAGDVGSRLAVQVIASNSVGSGSAVSGLTAVVASAQTTVTFSLGVGADDGDLAASGGSYPPAGAPAVSVGGSVLTAGRRFVFGGYQVLTGLLRFDTSSLPEGASVVSARLRLHVKAKADANDRRLVGEWYDPAAWPIDAGDFSAVAVADALAGADITGLTVNAVNELVLSDLSGIDPGGYSGLRLHIDGGQPGGDNYVQIASYDNTSLPEPKLIVTYTLDGGSSSAPVNTAAPVVSGSAVQGELLTASTGSWTGTQPISYVYQWRRCNTDGAACSDLQGATSQTYLAAAGDVGSRLAVQVIASNSVGSGSAVSGLTAVVASAQTTVTFSLGVGADDGDLAASGGSYPPAGAPAVSVGGSVLTAGRRFVFGGYQVLTGLLRFDTSSLPEGASVVSARLRLHVKAKADANDRRLVGEWYDPAAWPIDAGDFSAVAVADALAGADITGLTVNAVNELVLSDLSGIDPGGYSGLRLHIDGGQPGGDNYVQIASYDNTSLPEPKLIVTYTLDG